MVIHSFVEDEVLDKDREEFEKHLLKEVQYLMYMYYIIL